MVNHEIENKVSVIDPKKRRSRLHILLCYFTGGGGKEFDVYKNPDHYDDGAHSKIYRRDNLARGVADVVELSLSYDKNTSILDIGATGILSLELTKRGFLVTALDLFREPLHRLNEKAQAQGLISQVKTVQADMNQSWLFDNNSFGAVVSLRATRYIKDFDAWLGETYRVLEPNGSFVLPVFSVDAIPWKRHSQKGFRQKTNVRDIAKSITGIGFIVDTRASQKYTNIVDMSRGARNVPFYYKPTFILAKKHG